MLENLTKKLVADDVARGKRDIMIEGTIIPSKMSQIERYSLINEAVDCDDVKAVLNNITFDDTDTFSGRMEKLYEACMNPEVVSESIEIEKADKVKRLSMTKDDYDKIMNVIKDYVKTKDKVEKKRYRSKIESFVSTINSNITKADEVDAFIASALRKIYNVLCDDRPMPGTDKASAIVNIKRINTALN